MRLKNSNRKRNAKVAKVSLSNFSMLKYFGLTISIIVFLINLFYFDFEDPFFSEDNKVALIGIIGSLCAMILILILILSEKINSKIKGQ